MLRRRSVCVYGVVWFFNFVFLPNIPHVHFPFTQEIDKNGFLKNLINSGKYYSMFLHLYFFPEFLSLYLYVL